jgi:hypothetical protein
LGGLPPKPRIPHGYVEPQPEVLRRIALMVTEMHNGLASLGVMPEGLADNYERFAALCERLAAIADKELKGEQLSEDDDEFVANAARALKQTTILPDELRKKVLSETDSKMALIADVHTDTNSEVVLEEAVGAPFLLTVKMPLAGETTTLKGAVFSYYEFKHPMNDRLTDEAWQKMLAGKDSRPALPGWYPAGE